jgi:hypothetical protein
MPTYFEVHLDDRDLNYLLTQVFNQMNRLDRQLAGQEAYQFIPQNEKNTAWIIIPHQDLIYMITTTQSNLDEVQAILASFKFI